MTNKSKAQIQALLALLTRRHPAVCDALAQAARASLPADHSAALVEIIPMDVMGNVHADAVATVAALVAEIDSLPVTEDAAEVVA